ncbi:MAG TPA: hypothetical protein VF746_13200 [Longimicrobium sp.]|jgi:hypothetical protein
MFGTPMCRVDIPEVEGHPAQTVYHGGQSIYAVHPCTEEVARKAVARLRDYGGDPFPVHVPELAAARRIIERARQVQEEERQPAALPAGAGWDEDDDPTL